MIKGAVSSHGTRHIGRGPEVSQSRRSVPVDWGLSPSLHMAVLTCSLGIFVEASSVGMMDCQVNLQPPLSPEGGWRG